MKNFTQKAPEKQVVAPPQVKPAPEVVKKPENAPSTFTFQDPRELRSSVSALVTALDDVTGGTTAIVKLILSPKNTDYYTSLLKDKPYKALGEIVRTDTFIEGLMGSLKQKYAAIYSNVTDLRGKPLSVKVDKKLIKIDFVNKLVAILTWPGRKKQKSVTDACRLIYDLLEPIFGLKPEENTYLTNLEEKIASEIGSQGNTKSGGATLADFISVPKKQQKKKKKKAPAALKEEVNEKEVVPVVPQKQVPAATGEKKSEAEGQEADFDPIYNPDILSKAIPFGWQFGLLNKSILRKKAEAEGTREWFFEGTLEDLDNGFVFWSTSEVVFLFTTGSE